MNSFFSVSYGTDEDAKTCVRFRLGPLELDVSVPLRFDRWSTGAPLTTAAAERAAALSGPIAPIEDDD